DGFQRPVVALCGQFIDCEEARSALSYVKRLKRMSNGVGQQAAERRKFFTDSADGRDERDNQIVASLEFVGEEARLSRENRMQLGQIDPLGLLAKRGEHVALSFGSTVLQRCCAVGDSAIKVVTLTHHVKP